MTRRRRHEPAVADEQTVVIERWERDPLVTIFLDREGRIVEAHDEGTSPPRRWAAGDDGEEKGLERPWP